MKRKPIKLKESDLSKIVKKVISEQFGGCSLFTQPPLGGCPQGETWNGFPVCECQPSPPQEYCCMGGIIGGNTTCIPMPVGQCNPGNPNVMGGPFPTYQACDSGCVACTPNTGPPSGGCPQGEVWNGYPNCECVPQAPQEWCCMGGTFPGSTNCQQMPVGQCNPNNPNVMGGPFATYPDCNSDCVACNWNTGPPPGGCPQGEIWQGYPNCECITAPPQPAQAKKVWFKPCKYNYNPVTIDRTKKMTIDGQTPVVGDIFKIDLGPQDGFWNPSMNGAFVAMRVIATTQPSTFFSQTLDFETSHCKTLPPHEPTGISHAKVSQGGGKDGWIDKTKRETPGDETREPIKIKESDLTKIVKRLINEQTNPFSGGGSGPNWDAAQAAWANFDSNTQGSPPQADATFLSNMAGKGCGFYEKRLEAQVNSFVNQFGGSLGSSANQTNVTGGQNPAWQSQKYARIMWLSSAVQDCNSGGGTTNSSNVGCISNWIDDTSNDGPLDSATCANGNQAISAKNKENTKFRHKSISDCTTIQNKLDDFADAISSSSGCMQVRKQAKYDWLTNLKTNCC